MTEQDVINEGQVVKAFMTSDAGIAVFDRLKKAVYGAWCDAPTIDMRESVHKRGRAIADLHNELMQTIARGESAEAVRAALEEKEAKAAKK